MMAETKQKTRRWPWYGLMALILAGVATWYVRPGLWQPWLLQANRWSAGLDHCIVQTPSHSMHLLTRGSGPTVLMLHGIFAEKDHWVDFARAMPHDVRMVVPDLAGFGQSGRDTALPYDYAAQLRYLVEFMDAMGLHRVHVVGSSLGGTLGALLAAKYPHRVISLAFMGSPHGLRSQQPSDMDRAIAAGLAPLVPRTEAEFDAMLALVFADPPFLPFPVKAWSRQQALQQADSNQKVWDAQVNDRYLLDRMLPDVQTPVWALWGSDDRVFHVSGAQRLRVLQPEARIEVLDGVGHLPMMERPRASAEAYARFLAQQGGGDGQPGLQGTVARLPGPSCAGN